MMRQLALLVVALFITLNGWALSFTVDSINYSTTGSNTVEVAQGRYSGAITIPSSVVYDNSTYTVTAIVNNAFFGCTGLTSVIIPSSVTSIGSHAFSGISGLITVDSNNPNYSSKDGALFDKNRTTLIQCPISVMGYYNIPPSVSCILNDAFKGCTGLTSTSIPPLVTSIGNDAFSGCTGLTSITIPSSVTSIGNDAFYGCAGLASITIPSSVTRIGRDAFQRCSGLITVDFKNPKYTSKDGVLFNKNLTTLIQSPISVKGNYVIPSSVTSIGVFAFSGCTRLSSITIPSSVTSIGNFAFGSCTGLITVDSNNANYSSKDGVLYNKNQTTLIQCPKSIMGNFNIPSSAARIEQWAFYECNGLTSITIPSSVKSIQMCAFYYCTSLSSLKIHTTTPPILGKYVFSQVDASKCVLYVPTGSLSAYKAANQWKDFKTILEFDPTGIADVNLKSFLSTQPNHMSLSSWVSHPAMPK